MRISKLNLVLRRRDDTDIPILQVSVFTLDIYIATNYFVHIKKNHVSWIIQIIYINLNCYLILIFLKPIL